MAYAGLTTKDGEVEFVSNIQVVRVHVSGYDVRFSPFGHVADLLYEVITVLHGGTQTEVVWSEPVHAFRCQDFESR